MKKLSSFFFYIDQLLSQIGFICKKKLQWIKDYNTSFKEEFNADKRLNQQLDKNTEHSTLNFKTFYYHESKEFRDVILENLHLSSDAIKNICNSYDDKRLIQEHCNSFPEHFPYGYKQNVYF